MFVYAYSKTDQRTTKDDDDCKKSSSRKRKHPQKESFTLPPHTPHTTIDEGWSQKIAPASLVAGNELASVLPSVVDGGIGQVVGQVFEGRLAGDNGLDKEAEHGEHGKTAVLEFLDLELREGIGVVSQAKGVKGTTGVLLVETLSPVEAGGRVTESLSLAHEDDLDGDGGHDGLGVDQRGVAKVVETVIGEDGGTRLEPDGGITELGGTVALEELGGHAPQGTQHGPAGVDQFDLTVLGEGLGVSRETGGIPAVVTGVFTVEVRGGRTIGEGAQELGAVSTIPVLWILEVGMRMRISEGAMNNKSGVNAADQGAKR